MQVEVSYLLTERGELRIARACPKCQTPAPASCLRGVYRRVTCSLCEYEYAAGQRAPTMVPPHLGDTLDLSKAVNHPAYRRVLKGPTLRERLTAAWRGLVHGGAL